MKLLSVYPRPRRHSKIFTNDFDQLFQEFFKPYGKVTTRPNTRQTPAVNVIESSDHFRIEVAAPGLSKEDFNLQVEKDTLTISAERTSTLKDEEKYTRKEFNFFEFKRIFSLPESVDNSNITAKFENGILFLSLAKKEEAKELPPRKIEVV